ncbi:MAG: hypothetical protein R3C01_07315 [Planctomycetaceae bacterium]
MSGEQWVYKHDDDRLLDELPKWDNRDRDQWIGDFLCGWRPVSEYRHREYIDPTFGPSPDDYVSSEGTNGLFSQAFIDVIAPYMEPSFSLLPATLNGQPFYFLRHEGSVDCLDYENSDVEVLGDEYGEDAGKLMPIKRYSFHTEQLQRPLVFGLPGYCGYIFWTKPLVDICTEAGLTGVRFVSIEQINKHRGWTPPVGRTDE